MKSKTWYVTLLCGKVKWTWCRLSGSRGLETTINKRLTCILILRRVLACTSPALGHAAKPHIKLPESSQNPQYPCGQSDGLVTRMLCVSLSPSTTEDTSCREADTCKICHDSKSSRW
ncbi:hypothetical protein TNCV_3089711 [Trichonephila clavipes]|nr:hypothetical protein TNCV_3089711 [Trichonephila clavipes]